MLQSRAFINASMSHPSWGAWIEIRLSSVARLIALSSHPSWGAWIEIRTPGRTPRP